MGRRPIWFYFRTEKWPRKERVTDKMTERPHPAKGGGHKEGEISDCISSHTPINNPFKIFSHCYCYTRGLFKNTLWDILIVSKTCARGAGQIMSRLRSICFLHCLTPLVPKTMVLWLTWGEIPERLENNLKL